MDDLRGYGRSKLPVCVDCSVFPSGKFMISVPVAGWIFFSGDPRRKKLPVSPASVTAWLTAILFWICRTVFLGLESR